MHGLSQDKQRTVGKLDAVPLSCTCGCTCELALKLKTGTKDSKRAVTPSFVVEQIQTQWHLLRYLKVPGVNVSTWAKLSVLTRHNGMYRIICTYSVV